jgi:UDP-N-acetylglucosamine 2-epimerase (non-hydrolysing)
MKVVSVVGARPQFVKLAPVAEAFERAGIDHFVVHTGQHYDANMSQDFFDALDIPNPDINLGVGSGSHATQTAGLLTALEPVLTERRPDWVLVYGDTNSTLAGAVCAAKLNLPLAHLEAGLRSFNRKMPEEHNRVLTDHSSDLCLAPSTEAMDQLGREGLGHRAVMVGDVMIDILMRVAEHVRANPVDLPFDATHDFVLATIHRAENTDDKVRLTQIIGALSDLDRTVVLAAHPRLVARCADYGIELGRGSLSVIPPLAYPQLVQAVSRAHSVVTDSGGLQKEAHCLKIPTTTVRTETEWVETLADGWNVLAPEPDDIAPAVARPRPRHDPPLPFGRGDAAPAVVTALQNATKAVQ